MAVASAMVPAAGALGRVAGAARRPAAARRVRRARRAEAAAAAELPVCGDVVRVVAKDGEGGEGSEGSFGVVVEMGLGSVEVELLEALPEGEEDPLMPGYVDFVESERFEVRARAVAPRRPGRAGSGSRVVCNCTSRVTIHAFPHR